jgi:SAM-dependent methyltransferase
MSTTTATVVQLNPLQVLLWTFRRSGRDVVNLYNSLSPVMQLATGGDMLNFGYWRSAMEPVGAQQALCSLVGEVAELGSAKLTADVGSGLGAPAGQWADAYGGLQVACVNINYGQLRATTRTGRRAVVGLMNASSAALPLRDRSVDRVVALESAQHFKPLGLFASECARVLLPGGLLVLALPVMAARTGALQALAKLGILSFTWSSEHYDLDHVLSAVEGTGGLEVTDVMHIGRHVYGPLADYYMRNREGLARKILQQYPPILERVLCRSLAKMKEVSDSGTIDYVIVKAARK